MFVQNFIFLFYLVTNELCTYESRKGKCDMHITKFFYNVQTKECEYFVYSGCGGNANNFLSVLECVQKCKKGSALLIEVPASSNGKHNHTEIIPGQPNYMFKDNPRKKLLMKAVEQSKKRTLLPEDLMVKSKIGLVEEFSDDLKNLDSTKSNEIREKIVRAVSVLFNEI